MLKKLKKWILSVMEEELSREIKKDNKLNERLKKQIDSIEGYRDVMGHEDIYTKWKPEKLREIYANAALIYKNPIFKQVLDVLAIHYWDLALLNCKNTEQLQLGKGNVNGIGLVYQEFERLSNMYDSLEDKNKVEL